MESPLKIKIIEYRKLGMSHRAVGELCGVSRARIHQVDPTPLSAYGWFHLGEVAEILNLKTDWIRIWVNTLGIPTSQGNENYHIKAEGIEILREHTNNRKCKICGGIRPPRNKFYCSSECALVGRRKQKIIWLKEWRRKNPEGARAIAKRAYWKKKLKLKAKS